MKKLLCLVLAVVMLIFVCGCSASEPEKVTSEKTTGAQTGSAVEEVQTDASPQCDWQNIYNDLLMSAELGVSFNYIAVNDLNLDGTPELIVSNTSPSAACGVSVFCVNGEVAECVVGYNEMDEIIEDYNPDIIVPYSVFDDTWLTLRKNSVTGEYKYFMESGNGASNERFGGIYSFSADSEKCEPFAEFEYIETWEDGGYENIKGEYKVGGKSVTKEEYEKLLEEFYADWEDTGYRSKAISTGYTRYSEIIETTVTADTINNLFEQYIPEKEYINNME